MPEPVFGAEAGFIAEPSRECPFAAGCVRGEVGQVQGSVEVLQRPRPRLGEAAVSGLRDRSWRVLGLAAAAVRGDDVESRELCCGHGAVVAPDDVQTESTVEAIGFSTMHVNFARDAGERDLVMQMRGSSDRHRIDALGEQRIQRVEGTATGELVGARTMRLDGIDDTDQIDVGKTREHTRVVAAHHASANDADPKRFLRRGFHTRPELFGTHFIDPDQIKRETPRRFLARRHTCGECRDAFTDTI